MRLAGKTLSINATHSNLADEALGRYRIIAQVGAGKWVSFTELMMSNSSKT